jgi:hypothetical protein
MGWHGRRPGYREGKGLRKRFAWDREQAFEGWLGEEADRYRSLPMARLPLIDQALEANPRFQLSSTFEQAGFSPWTDRWVNRCRRLLALDRLLERIRDAGAEPANATRRLELAAFCCHPAKRLHRTAAHFAAEAFAAEPKLAKDLRQQHRYNAACSAVLAAAGQAEDARLLPDRVVSSLHRQALAWLRADLARYAADLKREPRFANAVRQRLSHWQKDPDLASVRDNEPLRRLPADERAAWRSLWDDVAALLKKTQPRQWRQASTRRGADAETDGPADAGPDVTAEAGRVNLLAPGPRVGQGEAAREENR